MSLKLKNNSDYIPHIDGLRALSVIFVIFFHAEFNYFQGGFLGVDVFFVISGFLITRHMIKEFKSNTFNLFYFYERRARRILPILIFVIITIIPFFIFTLLPYQLVDFAQSLVSIIFFLSNFLFWQESGYFGDINQLKPMLHSWSLSIEEQYYLFFPFLFFIFYKKKKILFFLIIIFIISLFIAEYSSNNFIVFNFFSTINRIWEIILGAIIAFQAGKFQTNRIIINQILSILGLFAILFSFLYFDESYPLPSFLSLLPTMGAALIILYANKKTFVNNILSSYYLPGLGLISYSAYLWHQPVFAFSRINFEIDNFIIKIILIIFILTLSFFTWKFIEKPFRKKNTIKLKYFIITVVSSIIFILFISFFIIYKSGVLKTIDSKYIDIYELNPLEQGRYVRKNFLLHRDHKFNEKSILMKILIIGDSYAQDFVNMGIESNSFENFEISTFYTKPECGLYFGTRDVSFNIAKKYKRVCGKERVINDLFKHNLINTDIVVLSSNWRLWDSMLINETIKNFDLKNNQTFLIIGKKNFGHIDLKVLQKEKLILENINNRVNEDFIEINNQMKNMIDKNNFVDIHKIHCESKDNCSIFTKNFKLISYDGSHLTKNGAKELGFKVFNSEPLKSLLKY